MRLHELTLENFRAIRRRTVTFPDAGLVVVAGDNERGKTTMIEALDILLAVKSSGKPREVRDAQPFGSDVAPVVEAVMTLGEHRVRYRKQYLRQNATTLTFLQGPRQGVSLTGDEAHDAVIALRSGTDRQLWEALRLLQATGLDAPALEDSSALQKALDRHSGGEDASTLSAGDSLVERAEKEYLRYFTPTGKPTGDYSRAIAEFASRTEAAQGARAALAEIEALTEQLAKAEERVALAEESLATHGARAQATADALAAVEAAQRAHDAASHRADLARARREAADDAVASRAALAGALEAREAEKSAADEALAEAAEALEPWHASATEARDELDRRRATLAEARLATAAARTQLEAAEAAEEGARLAGVVEALDRTSGRLAATTAVVESMTFDAEDVARLEAADRALASAEAALGAGSARLAVSRTGDAAPLLIDGSAAEDGADHPVTQSLSAEVPGAWQLTLSPAAGTQDRRDDVDRAREARAALAAQLGVRDPAEGHARLREAEAARAELTALQAERRTLLGERSEAEVRASLEEYRRTSADAGAPQGVAASKAALAEALDAQAAAEEAESEATARVEARRTGHQEARDHHTRAEATAAAAKSAVGTAATHLAAARAHESDAALEEARSAATEADEAAAAEVESTHEDLVALAPESVRAEAETAGNEGAGLTAALAQAKENRTRLDGELTGRGAERRQAEAEAAEAAEEVAGAEHSRLERRARAARLLRETLVSHRDAARKRYVAPFAEAIRGLGRPVFGPDFQVGISETLDLESRTLDGVTVPFDLLSSGAKEQLGIVVRLATAMLVDPDDGVPVLLDDALGYSDDHRRARVLSVLGRAAESTQVIVLTCTPERYAALRGKPGVAFEEV